MTTVKNLILLLCLAGCFAACKNKDFNEEQQFKTDTTLIRKFITENSIPAKKDEKTGLFYQILEPGQGQFNYTLNTTVSAQYVGKLLNGTQFDATTAGQDFTFALGQVIPGWQFGVKLVQKGGKIRLLVPSLLAYQNKQTGPIPPNSVLDFTITVTNLK